MKKHLREYVKYAECGKCGNQLFKLRLEPEGEQWRPIMGTECENCGIYQELLIKAEEEHELAS